VTDAWRLYERLAAPSTERFGLQRAVLEAEGIDPGTPEGGAVMELLDVFEVERAKWERERQSVERKDNG